MKITDENKNCICIYWETSGLYILRSYRFLSQTNKEIKDLDGDKNKDKIY